MALQVKFAIKENPSRKSLDITENTGAYNINNPGGYGAPNPELVDVDSVTLALAKRNKNGTYPAANTFSVFSVLPSATFQTETVTAEQLGYGTDATFEDGIYKITYTATIALSENSEEITKIFFGNIQCCYKKMIAAKLECGCLCSDPEFECFTTQYMTLYLAIAEYEKTGEEVMLNHIQSLITLLTNMCLKTNCGCI